MNRRLPALAEHLGQVRALAVAAAAQGHCSPAGRARLVDLLDGAGRAVLPGHQSAALLERIAREVLVTPGISIEPERLYRDITQQIDAVFCSIRDLLQELQLEQQVSAPRPTRLR